MSASSGGSNLLKSYTLVAIQFGALGLLALTGPLLARHPLLLALEVAALALGLWALLTVRIHKVSVIPDVRQGARLVSDGPLPLDSPPDVRVDSARRAGVGA
jgi:hypothetical protein